MAFRWLELISYLAFFLPKTPFINAKTITMPLYLFCYDSQGLISGSAELREQAALGLGELIEVTSEEALKEFVIPITGYALCES